MFLSNISRLIRGEIPTKTLIKRGMKVGTGFNRQQGVYLDPTHCWLIEIGDNVTMSVHVTLLAHDASTKAICGYTKLGRITVGSGTFIGAGATLLPGVTVGEGAIIGAGSVVTRDIPAYTIAAGSPARVIRTLEQQKQRFEEKRENSVFLGEEYTMRGNVDGQKKEEMKTLLSKKDVYII